MGMGGEWRKKRISVGKEEPDETRANYGRDVGQTTPVGVYPAGAQCH